MELRKDFVQFVEDMREHGITPSCFLDCGSRDGQEALACLHFYPDCEVHAFEPARLNFEICQKETAGSKVNLWKLALSDFEGEAAFYYTPSNIGASSLLKPDFIPWSSSRDVVEERVEVVTLDSWALRQNVTPDVLWVDLQGNELNLFKGATRILENVKIIHSEMGLKPYYQGHTLRDDIVDFLKGRGFKIIREEQDWEHESNLTLIKQ